MPYLCLTSYLCHCHVSFAASTLVSCPELIEDVSPPQFLPAGSGCYGCYLLGRPHSVLWTLRTQDELVFEFTRNGLPIPANGNTDGCQVVYRPPQPGDSDQCLHQFKYICSSGRIEGGGKVRGVIRSQTNRTQVTDLGANIEPLKCKPYVKFSLNHSCISVWLHER